MKGRVTIIGLGCVGTSIGLALRTQGPDVEVIGHDKNPEHARTAARLNAVHKTHWNLPAACDGAALIVLALPLPAVRDTLAALGRELEKPCVITDTAPLKTPVLEWARDLPAHVDFITGVPLPGPGAAAAAGLVGPEAGRVDLFEDGLYCITPTENTTTRAVNLLTGLAHALGARPLFLDPLEYDGLQAGVVDLPVLLALALLRSTVDKPGWIEMRKVAGHDFATLTDPVAVDPGGRLHALLLNRENLLRRLDMLLAELDRIRRQIVEGDEAALEAAYTRAVDGRARWLAERARGDWFDSIDQPDVPGMGEIISQMLVGGLFRRRPRREDD